MHATAPWEFPDRLDRLKANLRAQEALLRRVAGWFADTIAAGGCVHIYTNGHSRIAVTGIVLPVDGGWCVSG